MMMRSGRRILGGERRWVCVAAALILLIAPAPAFARAHAQVFVGANFVLALGPRVHAGVSLSAAGTAALTEFQINGRGDSVLAPVLGPWGEIGWIAHEGWFEAVGGSLGVAYPVTGSGGDCVGYAPAAEADAVLGYRWTKAGNGLEEGGRVRVLYLGALDVVGTGVGVDVSVGAAFAPLPECFLLM